MKRCQHRYRTIAVREITAPHEMHYTQTLDRCLVCGHYRTFMLDGQWPSEALIGSGASESTIPGQS